MSKAFVGAIVIVLCVVAFPQKASAIPIVFGHGAKIYKVCDIPDETQLAFNISGGVPLGSSLGYKCKVFQVFWMPLAMWDGEYCIYKDDTYLSLKSNFADSSEDIGISKAKIHRPFWSYIPWGWLVVGPIILLWLASKFAPKQSTKQVPAEALAVSNDPSTHNE